MGVKITLAQVRQQNRYAYLVIHCASTPAQDGGCHHTGEMSLLHAIVLWGEDKKLDELPLRCSKCGARKVDVRSDHPRNEGGNPRFK
ncbi:MAG: hypothetical protein M0D54_13900 [Hyphomonadaceae bacterium JAD_PAG50586_4]|nr:MAG: hypothetical protein M0D54_13900 [Hyphomonadaceae bacterium JAD_PAG50586_4]